MAFEPIREALKTLISGVDGIADDQGQVHDYVRHSAFWDKFFADNVGGSRINVWEITRRSMGEDLETVQNKLGNEPLFQDNHAVVIIGRMSLNDEDATEKIFQDLIDRIIEAVRKNNRLGGAVLLPRQLQIAVIDHRTHGGVLCHYTELTYEAIRREGGSGGKRKRS